MPYQNLTRKYNVYCVEDAIMEMKYVVCFHNKLQINVSVNVYASKKQIKLDMTMLQMYFWISVVSSQCLAHWARVSLIKFFNVSAIFQNIYFEQAKVPWALGMNWMSNLFSMLKAIDPSLRYGQNLVYILTLISSNKHPFLQKARRQFSSQVSFQ